MAQRIRALDWGATPLGCRPAWPQSLKTAVDVVLASPLAMAVLWGSELTQIHNDRFAEISGEGHDGRLGQSARSFRPETWSVDTRACDRALAGETLTFADQFYPDAGARPASETRLSLTYAPLRREDNQVGGVLVSVVEVPPRRDEGLAAELARHEQVEERLRESERRLRLALEASAAGAWSWDARTNQATWDERYHEMYGFEPDDERTHEAWVGRLHPEDRARVVARLDQVLETPGDDDWNMEFRAICPGRGVVWMQGLGKAVRDGEGRVLAMTGINLDINERKRAEEKLRESEHKLRLFTENAPAAVAMFDRDMRYLAVSRRFLKNFDVTGDIIGRSHYEVFPDLPERWKEVHRRCLAGAVGRADEDRLERADGSIYWLRWEVLPWHDDAGEIGGIIIRSEDITEGRQWRESQQVLIAELQHRTRNLLTVVESIAHQTMRSTDSVDAFNAQFGARLRALSRVQALLSRSNREPITIGALVRMELDAILGPETARQRTSVHGPEVSLRKRGVQTLALAIHELATNACKYGALAADRGTLSVTWRIEDGEEADRRLALEWLESGLDLQPDHADLQRRGYGRTLIERALPYTLAAQTTFELGLDAFRCSIGLPLRTDADDEAAEDMRISFES